jgi:hypothetical protein
MLTMETIKASYFSHILNDNQIKSWIFFHTLIFINFPLHFSRISHIFISFCRDFFHFMKQSVTFNKRILYHNGEKRNV